MGLSELIVNTFSSQLKDLRSFRCDSLPRFCILFFDISSVRRVVILLIMEAECIRYEHADSDT